MPWTQQWLMGCSCEKTEARESQMGIIYTTKAVWAYTAWTYVLHTHVNASPETQWINGYAHYSSEAMKIRGWGETTAVCNCWGYLPPSGGRSTPLELSSQWFQRRQQLGAQLSGCSRASPAALFVSTGMAGALLLCSLWWGSPQGPLAGTGELSSCAGVLTLLFQELLLFVLRCHSFVSFPWQLLRDPWLLD